MDTEAFSGGGFQKRCIRWNICLFNFNDKYLKINKLKNKKKIAPTRKSATVPNFRTQRVFNTKCSDQSFSFRPIDLYNHIDCVFLPSNHNIIHLKSIIRWMSKFINKKIVYFFFPGWIQNCYPNIDTAPIPPKKYSTEKKNWKKNCLSWKCTYSSSLFWLTR